MCKLILSSSLLFLFLFTGFTNGTAKKTEIAPTISEIFGRPTNDSITISILFNQHMDVFMKYGTEPSTHNQNTLQVTAIKIIPVEIEFINLNADTKHYY